MKSFNVFCFAVLAVTLSWTATGQYRLERFEVGAYNIYGNMRYPVPNTKWGSWVGDTASRGSRVEMAIPTERWEQLEEQLRPGKIEAAPAGVPERPAQQQVKRRPSDWMGNGCRGKWF